MDTDALQSAILSIVVLSNKLRAAREGLPVLDSGPSRLAKFLHEVERDLHVTKATLAGFALCPRCWPPEFVAPDVDGGVNCPACGEVSHELTDRANRLLQNYEEKADRLNDERLGN